MGRRLSNTIGGSARVAGAASWANARPYQCNSLRRERRGARLSSRIERPDWGRPRTTEIKMRDPYEVLGVSKSATAGEIKSAFRKLAKKHHPDQSKEPRAK